jgi:octaprenyl-diphosphate synthase
LSGTATVHPAVRSLYGPIKTELAQVELRLKNELRSQYPFVNKLLEHGVRLSGKRLRPALLLLAAKAIGKVTADHYTLAAVIEMIHTATLIHDDVLDEADVRRHYATVNSLWNNETSVLLGDYLFTHAFYLASTLDTTYACRRIGQSTNIVCEGELRQIASRGRFGLTEEEYYAIIDGKTAELCACACHLGAYFSDAEPDVVTAMERFGRSLGMAFQIADDLLDLIGDESKTGKSLGTDLEKQKPTLPIIHVCQKADPAECARFIEILERNDADQQELVIEWLDRYKGIEYARGKSIQFARQAESELEVLPESACRNVLAEMTEFVVSRSA